MRAGSAPCDLHCRKAGVCAGVAAVGLIVQNQKGPEGPLYSVIQWSHGQFFFQQLMQRSKLRLANIAPDDIAFFIDHESGWRQFYIAK